MTCRLFMLVIGFLPCQHILSQQIARSVIATAGDVSTAGHVILEWTLGEPVIETIRTKDFVFTQGFHQPVLKSKGWLAELGPQQERILVTVLPNPVQHLCRVFIDRDSETSLYLMLTDVQGRLLFTKTSHAKTGAIEFNFSSYAAGVYTLMVVTASGSFSQSYKIIKAD